MSDAAQTTTEQPDSVLSTATAPDATPAAPAASAPPAADTKPAETAPAVPEKYELKLPEGVELASDAVDKVAATARELGLSNDAAQKLLDHEVALRAELAKQYGDSFLAKQGETHKAKVAEWKAAATADPEISGSIGAIQQARDKFASPELVKLMDESGFGNHPEVLKFFIKVGKAMAEDRFHGSGHGGERLSPEQRWYPDMVKNT